ncbi:MAG: hypothetical protein JSU90_04480 [Nitrospiraceae bacterium]|nr:MAG: hypothetical protein JSU90_04480 [Nitrospiraceae bacterium]
MDYVIALTIHVIAIVIWIGGVAFVTMVTFPMILRMEKSLEMVMVFQGVEHRFGKIAKVMVILAGLSGLYLLNVKGFSAGVWIMIILWVVYASLLFGLEKMIFKKLFSRPGEQADMKTVFNMLQVFHWIVLALSLFAIAAGVYAGHY